MKMHNIIWDPIAKALEKVNAQIDLEIEDNRKFRKFLFAFQGERNEGVATYNKYKEKIDARDAEFMPKWLAYLNSEVEVSPLPFDYLKKVKGNITQAEYQMVQPLFEPDPEFAEVEAKLHVVPSGANLD